MASVLRSMLIPFAHSWVARDDLAARRSRSFLGAWDIDIEAAHARAEKGGRADLGLGGC